MNWVKKLTVVFGILLIASPASAIPGQTTDEAAAWMQSNPTLRPNRGEKFLIRRNNTVVQGFSFSASIVPPGRIGKSPINRVIKSETLTLFDMRNGVTIPRLREAVRSIYGIDIAQDFDQAQIVQTYPNDQKIAQAVQNGDAQTAALQGELRQGERFGYWIEIAQTDNGLAYSGRLTVFLKPDLDKLAAELKTR